ncbi:MAG: YjbH domain-containing protein [Aliishimia sp.]
MTQEATKSGTRMANRCSVLAMLCVSLAPISVFAQETSQRPWARTPVNTLGVPGMIDTPTAHPLADADMVLTGSYFNSTSRQTFYFQITPRLSGVFRYSGIDEFLGRGQFYDRSFDLRYVLAEETGRRPAISVGLQDFGGTGIYSSEYIVATKTFGRLRATGGIGWGRLGSRGGFDNPLSILSSRFDSRPNAIGGLASTGQLDSGNWFRGDAALFGGIQYQLNDRTILTAEYSSDAYIEEEARVGFDQKIPFNFGASYSFPSGVEASGFLLYGDAIGVQFSYVLNPKGSRVAGGGIDPAPSPVGLRAPGAARDLGWTTQADAPAILQDNAAKVFERNGLSLEGIKVSAHQAEVRFRNATYQNSAQAVGRAARVMSSIMPASVETFVIIPITENGLPASSITLQRRDLEELELAPDGTWQSYARAEISDAPTRTFDPADQSFPRFSWGIGPFLDLSLFDPSSPIRADFGIALRARYEPKPGLVFSGRVKQRLNGDRGDLPASNSVIQRVRSDTGLYAQEGETAIEHLTGAYYFRPGADLYGRVTAGYLESMFGGVSGELLWKPVSSRWAFGAEINYAKQRDFDQQFGFQSYDVVTGHASAYLDVGNGFHVQADAGRYLAGDWGSTLTLEREFANGVQIGAFATLTDVSFSDFGEGSFDKGITITVPLAFLTGRSTQNKLRRIIRPVTRDGGARLFVDGRLYESVRSYHQVGLQDQWGRFWR